MFLLRRLTGKLQNDDSKGNDGSRHSATADLYLQEEPSRKALDQASEYVREGKFERALWLLEKLGQLYPAVKEVAELVAVAEVCYATVSRPCMCLARQHRIPDWYKVLKVDQNSDFETIKKRYRQLALLLHPDKNKHAKAEGAFKMVSEAYACLSDKKKRENFNIERSLQKQCKLCSQIGTVTSESDRWSGYGCARERKTKLRRQSSVSDLTQDDWVLDQERLKVFRERARARMLSTLAKAWKVRSSKLMEGFDFEKGRSFSRNFERSILPMKGELEGNKHCRQQDQNTGEQNVHRMCDVKAKSFLSTQTMTSTISGLHNRQLDSISQRNSKKRNYEISKHYKSLEVLIRQLRAELNECTDSTSNIRYPWGKGIHQEPLAGDAVKTECNFVSTAGTFFGRLPREEDCTCRGKEHSATGTSGMAFESHIRITTEIAVAQQEGFCRAQQSVPRKRYSGLCNSSNEHSSDSEDKFSDPDLSDNLLSSNLSSKILSSITNRFHQKENESPLGFSNRNLPDWTCSGCTEEKHPEYNRSMISSNETKNGGERCASGLSSSVSDSLLKQRNKGANCYRIARNKEEITPCLSTLCEEPILHRPICRGDSLDMEEKILRTQKEKSEQLLKTLQRLREEAKSMAASLDCIRYGHIS